MNTSTMNSIVTQIKDMSFLPEFIKMIDKELDQTYGNTDCVDHYSEYFVKERYVLCLESLLDSFIAINSDKMVDSITAALKASAPSPPTRAPLLSDISADVRSKRTSRGHHLIHGLSLISDINEKPYKCWLQDCNQCFYQKCELRVHLIRHLEDKP